MENDRAPQEIEALTREVARLEQVVAEKRFDESRVSRSSDEPPLGFRIPQAF